MLSVGSDLTRAGNAFQALAAATGKARSPSVERLVGGTSSVTVSLARVCHLMLRRPQCLRRRRELAAPAESRSADSGMRVTVGGGAHHR